MSTIDPATLVADRASWADSWPSVSSLTAAMERAAEAGNHGLAKDCRRQAEAMRRRLESGKGEVGAGGRGR